MMLPEHVQAFKRQSGEKTKSDEAAIKKQLPEEMDRIVQETVRCKIPVAIITKAAHGAIEQTNGYIKRYDPAERRLIVQTETGCFRSLVPESIVRIEPTAR